MIGARRWLQLVLALLPAALAAQEELKPANGSIRDSISGVNWLRELHDGRVLYADNHGGVLVADFTTGRAKAVPGVKCGVVPRFFALGGDSTLIIWRDGAVVLDGTTPVADPSVKVPRTAIAPVYTGADNRGFLLGTIGRRPDDSATLVRHRHMIRESMTTLTRLWLRPLVGPMPFADMQEQAVLAPDGWIAVFRAEAYRVDWRTPAGEWLLGAPLVLPVLAMDAREKEIYIDMMRGFVAPGTEDFTTGWPKTVELFSGSSLMMPTPDSGVLIRHRLIA